jgi:hypothetical protein
MSGKRAEVWRSRYYVSSLAAYIWRSGCYVSRLAAYIWRYQDKDWSRIQKPI